MRRLIPACAGAIQRQQQSTLHDVFGGTGSLPRRIGTDPNSVPRSSAGIPCWRKAAADAIDKWKWTPPTEETKEPVELHFHPE
jgi:hypothetical protein